MTDQLVLHSRHVKGRVGQSNDRFVTMIPNSRESLVGSLARAEEVERGVWAQELFGKG